MDPEESQECLEILRYLTSRPVSAPFLEPVDWKSLGLPDYPNIVKNPMDLGTVEKKLLANKYLNSNKFAADVRLTFINTKTYNQPGSEIYNAADGLHKAFEKRFAKIFNKNKRSLYPSSDQSSPYYSNIKASAEDRTKFTSLVDKLHSDQLGHLVEIIEKRAPQALKDSSTNITDNTDTGDIEIEITAIDGDTLGYILRYAQKCVEENTGVSYSNFNKTKRVKLE